MPVPDEVADGSGTGAGVPPAAQMESKTVAKLLAVSGLLGVVVALGFEGFETLSHRSREWVWHDLAGAHPRAAVTLAITTVGGLALGLALRYAPGHGGQHPADGHALYSHDGDRLSVILGVLVVGFVGLVAGASLGPEGAVIPAAAGLSLAAGRWFRLPPALAGLLPGVGISALLATMFGSPLAGAVPVMEMVPAGSALPMPLLMLPSLTASATAVLTLQVLHAEPAGYLELGHVGFARGDLAWAVLIGVVVGGVGLLVDWLTPVLRPLTRRLDAKNVLITTTVGGFGLGLIYVVGGDEARFSGVPELLEVTDGSLALGAVVLAIAAKVIATAWCVSVGFRGGKIFPVAFMGGAAGFALHLAIGGIPVGVAVGGGIAAALATGLRAPVTAVLVAASLVGPEFLPLAVICVVVSHATHLLADQLAAFANSPDQTQGSHA